MSSAASGSASAVVADEASGYHDLKIERYSTLKALPTGECVSSSPFTVGGHRWRIECYLNGSYQDSAGHVSMFLVLDESVAGAVTASFRFSFMSETENSWIFFFNKPSLAQQQTSPVAHTFTSKEAWGFPKFVKREALEQSRHLLMDDSFTIRCDLVVVNGYKVRALTPPSSDLNQHLGDLLRTGKGADVVFEAGGEKFAAHRCVLAARSPVFSAELFGSMKEGVTGLVRVHGMEAPVFSALLCFVYTDSLPPEMNKEEAEADLLVAADRYGMDRLKLICEDKLCKQIDVGTVANILALAEAHNCHMLKNVCFDFLGRKANLTAVMASDGFEHLNATCPAVVRELFAMHSMN